MVSPLVSLMQDQVEALERVAPGRVGLVNAQRDAAANRRASSRRPPATCGCSTSRRSGSPRRASSSACAAPTSACSWSTRRTACRSGGTTSGPTTSGSPTPRAGSGPRRSWPRRRPRRRRWRRDIVRAARAARPGAGGDRVRPAEPSFAVVPCATKEAKHRRIAAALAERRAARDRLRGHARGCDELADAAGPRARRAGRSLPRRARRASVRAEAQRRFMAGESQVVVATNAFGMGVDKADVRTVCHERSAARSRPTTRRPAAPGATASPRAACCSPAARQGPARVLHRALDGRRGRDRDASPSG